MFVYRGGMFMIELNFIWERKKDIACTKGAFINIIPEQKLNTIPNNKEKNEEQN